jgi:hypothetical protein
LALEHQFALKAPDCTDDREHQLTGRRARIGTQVQNGKVSTLVLHAFGDIKQMLRGSGEPVELRHDQGIAFTDEIDRGIKLRALADRGYLFGKNLLASASSEIPELGIEAGLLCMPM